MKIFFDVEMFVVIIIKNVVLLECLVSRGVKKIVKIVIYLYFVFINILVEGICVFVYVRVNIRVYYFRIGGEFGCFFIVYFDVIFLNMENINLMGFENDNNIVVFCVFDVDCVFFFNESVV